MSQVVLFKSMCDGNKLPGIFEKIASEIKNRGLDINSAMVTIEVCGEPKDLTVRTYPLFEHLSDEHFCTRPEPQSCCQVSLRPSCEQDGDGDRSDVGLDSSDTF